MKIIQITAAYKPAYIYGGPTMSVAKLCECVASKEVGKSGSWRVGELAIEENNNYDPPPTPPINRSELSKGGHNGANLIAQCGEINIKVFTTTANGKSELEVEPNKCVIVDGVEVTYFKRLTKDHTHFSPALLWGLRKEILVNKKNPPPTPAKGGQHLVIHIHAWWNLVSVLSCMVAKLYNIPVILSPRGMLTTYTNTNRNSVAKKLIHYSLGKKLLKYCHIHATSEQEKQDILSIVTPKSITVIPNLVALGDSLKHVTLPSDQRTKLESLKQFALPSLQEALVPIYRKGSGVRSPRINNSTAQPLPFKLIFLSRIEEKKGLDLLFEALANFNVNWSLTIAGSGDEEYILSLKTKAESLKLNHNYWIGQVKNEDKFKLLAEHDLMVLTSHNENFANVVIESLSVGTPVLLSDQVGLADYILTKDLGWVSELNADSINHSLHLAFNDQIKRSRLRKSAPSLINEDFNDEILVEKYFNLYENLANGRL
ncbi:MAG: glycosyltransferase [Pedobacter sp.]|nr:MAG: glycosyltransferase [Pedobacter sp.]